METANNKGKNIEALTSTIAYEIVSKGILNESEINKLLGVLTNNGVYAMWVYAQANFKNEKISEFARRIEEIPPLSDFSKDEGTPKESKRIERVNNNLREISENLPQLLLLKQLLEKTLTYARYHAKASGDKK